MAQCYDERNGIFRNNFGSDEPLVSAAAAKSLQSCPTLCDPIDSSPPGSPVPGILQARTLDWVAIAFSLERYKSKLKDGYLGVLKGT